MAAKSECRWGTIMDTRRAGLPTLFDLYRKQERKEFANLFEVTAVAKQGPIQLRLQLLLRPWYSVFFAVQQQEALSQFFGLSLDKSDSSAARV